MMGQCMVKERRGREGLCKYRRVGRQSQVRNIEGEIYDFGKKELEEVDGCIAERRSGEVGM